MAVSDRRRLGLVALLVAAANLADLASTYLASPNLAGEWNLLERQFGLGWSGLVGAKLIGGLLAILGYAYYLRHRAACYPPPGVEQGSFCRFFAFGASDVAPPRDGGAVEHLLVNLGYFWTGMQVLVLWVALDNLLLTRGFVWGIRYQSELGYHLLQSAVVAAVVLARFYRGNYRRYQSHALRPITRAAA